MRSLLLVGGGILIGAGLAWGEAHLSAEKKVQQAEKDYWKQWADHLNDNYSVQGEAPAESEDELTFNADGAVLEQTVAPDYIAAYQETATQYGDPEQFVQVSKMEFISEEEYHEEDGRAKEQIQVFMGEGDPYFVQDGMVIEDWSEKIGDGILVTFYQQFQPTDTNRTIYLRNHARDEDFEIIQEMGP